MPLHRSAAWTTGLQEPTIDRQASNSRPSPTVEALFDAVQVCEISLGVASRHQFEAWVRGPLNSLIPHFGLLVWSSGTDCRPGALRVFQGDSGELHSFQPSGFDATRFGMEARRRWRLADRVPTRLSSKCLAVDSSSLAPPGVEYVVHGVQPLLGEPETLLALVCDTSGEIEETMLLTRLIAPFLVLALHRVDCATSPHKPALAVSQSPACHSPLSRQEIRILECIRDGMTNAAIGSALEISPFTVKSHLQRVFRKFQVSTRTQAVAVALSLGIIGLGSQTAASLTR